MVDVNKTKDELVEELVELRKCVDELRAKQSELKQLGDLLVTLVNNSTVGIYIVQNKKFVFANPQFQTYVGYNADELYGVDSLSLVHPDDRDMVRENAVKVLRGESASSYEFRYITKNGETMWVKEIVASMQYKGEKATLGFFLDITEDKVLAELLNELYKKEAELSNELQAEMDNRVNFTRALVHELKNPLTPIIAASDFLLTRLEDEVSLRLARNISTSAYNLNELIDELFDVAKGEIGMLHMELKSVDLLQLLRRVADEMSPVASNRKQSLTLNLPSSLPVIQADETRLQQVVKNLLSNAFKFTSEGGSIILAAEKVDNSLVISVQDNGRGITSEAQEWIFEPYFQVKSVRGRSSGLGLGLALCKIFVELHGGQIWVKSQVNQGSTFSFSIPLEAVNLTEESLDNN